ncbi:MAG TPA: hypothetical protein VGG28_04920 [Kofleriaceae bacterium]|jgi:hypothetical protein
MSPNAVAPYFMVVALIHAAAVATRFDALAAKLPAGVATAVMIAQFPLLVLSGFFEGKLDYGPNKVALPLWMRIKSVPVKLAFTFGFMFVATVVLQTLHVSIGPIDPTPPMTMPDSTRAMWFAVFTAGMFFPFYLAATGLLIPVLRVITAPARVFNNAIGGVVALVLGGAIGVVVFALATKTAVPAFVDAIKAGIEANPPLAIAVTLAMTLIPLAIGLVRERAK